VAVPRRELAADDHIAEGSNADGRIEVFLIGQNGQFYTDTQQAINGSTWSGWQSFGGDWPVGDSIAEGANADGRMEVFLIGRNGQLYTDTQQVPNHGWGTWQSLGS
jgi:hypothetical protein